MGTAGDAPLQAKGFTPGLTVNDLERSIAFYEGLGFVITDRWEREGTLVGVMLGAGQARLGLSQDDWKKGRDRVKGVGMRMWIGTGGDIDEIAERARAAGVPLDTEPYDTEWGTRAMELTDPDGFRLTVSTDT